MICKHGDDPLTCHDCIRARQQEIRRQKLAAQPERINCLDCGAPLLLEDDWCMNIRYGRYCGRLAPKYTRKA